MFGVCVNSQQKHTREKKAGIFLRHSLVPLSAGGVGEEKSAWGVGRGPRSSFSLESRVRDTLRIDFSAHVRVQVVCCFLKTYLRIMRLVAYFFRNACDW